MSVVRIDLNKCIGCGNCVDVCPMDVFYFDHEANRSVIVYPEDCQSCGQCYLNCRGRSLGMTNEAFGYPLTAARALSTAPRNHFVVTDPGALYEFSKGHLPAK